MCRKGPLTRRYSYSTLPVESLSCFVELRSRCGPERPSRDDGRSSRLDLHPVKVLAFHVVDGEPSSMIESAHAEALPQLIAEALDREEVSGCDTSRWVDGRERRS